MNYLISGLAKSGTTILFSRLEQALSPAPNTFFEPDQDEQLAEILSPQCEGHSLTKVLIGRVSAENKPIAQFDRHILIYRDPRDQFISMLLYLFYDFQLSGDSVGYQRARTALQQKVDAPAEHSTIELYNLLASLVGRAPIRVFNNLHRVQQEFTDAFDPLLLRYEDFVDNKLQAAARYLELDLHNDAQVPEQYGRVARSRGYGEWSHWLNSEDLAYINQTWGSTITRQGYELADIATDLGIAHSSSLGYIEQFDPQGA